MKRVIVVGPPIVLQTLPIPVAATPKQGDTDEMRGMREMIVANCRLIEGLSKAFRENRNATIEAALALCELAKYWPGTKRNPIKFKYQWRRVKPYGR